MKRKSLNFKYNTSLLIDDNDLDNFINEKMLEVNQFYKEIVVCNSCQNALELFDMVMSSNGEKNFPEVMFVDLNMPVMNGFEFIEQF